MDEQNHAKIHQISDSYDLWGYHSRRYHYFLKKLAYFFYLVAQHRLIKIDIAQQET